jgi:N-acetylmuramoyl-L-alanine amidase
MALMPGVVQKPVSAHGGLISSVLGVVEHVTAGEGDPYNEFANPNNQVSSHFGIGNGQGGMADGLIEQYVDTQYQSWAQAAGNSTYISVETEGEPTEALTAAQVASFGRIMAWANATYGVPLVITDTVGQRGLITHGDGGVAWGNHIDCPGDIRKGQRQAILNAAAPAPPPPPGYTGGLMFDGLALNEQDNFYATLRYLWATFRTDTINVSSMETFWYVYNLPVANQGFGGSMDACLANLIDTASAHGVLRPAYVGAA